MFVKYFTLADMSENVTVAQVADRTGLRGVAEAGGCAPGIAYCAYYSHGKVRFVFVSYSLHVIDCRWSDSCGSGGGEKMV